MLHRLRSWLRSSPEHPASSPREPLGAGAQDLLRRIHREDVYAGFPLDGFPLDRQGWNSDSPVFRRMLEEVRPRLVVELGTWKGGSALHMCDLADRMGLSPVVMVCVDTWLGGAWHWIEDRRPESFPSLACRHGYPTIYRQFLANVIRSGHAGKVVPIPNTTDAAAEIFRAAGTGPIDLLYVDASHEEPAVHADLVNWWPMLRAGGVAFGDDFIAEYPGVERAVRRFAADHGLSVEVDREKWIMRKSTGTPTAPDR